MCARDVSVLHGEKACTRFPSLPSARHPSSTALSRFVYSFLSLALCPAVTRGRAPLSSLPLLLLLRDLWDRETRAKPSRKSTGHTSTRWQLGSLCVSLSFSLFRSPRSFFFPSIRSVGKGLADDSTVHVQNIAESWYYSFSTSSRETVSSSGKGWETKRYGGEPREEEEESTSCTRGRYRVSPARTKP